MKAIAGFLRREKVFAISLALALVSLPANVQGFPYAQYVDFDVIMLLFALMGVVAGFRALGVFDSLARALLAKAHNARLLAFVLMALCFFLSMLVTNDVALLTLVPLTLGALSVAAPDIAAPVVVLETVAANLGSMATPMGNPQNLYIYTAFSLDAGSFLGIMLPLTLLSFVLLTLLCLLIRPRPLAAPGAPAQDLAVPAGTRMSRRALLTVYSLLAAVCLLALFRVIPKYVCCAAVLVALAICSPRVLARIDYALLATFACFFIFVGNVGAIPAVSEMLRGAIAGRELILGAALSQVISNVPATFMLAPFATDTAALMKGVNIGGLGTPVASLASLISLKLFARAEGADTGRFMRLFTAVNFGLLIVLLAAAHFM